LKKKARAKHIPPPPKRWGGDRWGFWDPFRGGPHLGGQGCPTGYNIFSKVGWGFFKTPGKGLFLKPGAGGGKKKTKRPSGLGSPPKTQPNPMGFPGGSGGGNNSGGGGGGGGRWGPWGGAVPGERDGGQKNSVWRRERGHLGGSIFPIPLWARPSGPTLGKGGAGGSNGGNKRGGGGSNLAAGLGVGALMCFQKKRLAREKGGPALGQKMGRDKTKGANHNWFLTPRTRPPGTLQQNHEPPRGGAKGPGGRGC